MIFAQVSRDGLRRTLLIQGVHDAEREDEVTAAQNRRADGAGDETDADAVERHELADRFEARRGFERDGQRERAGEILLDGARRGPPETGSFRRGAVRPCTLRSAANAMNEERIRVCAEIQASEEGFWCVVPASSPRRRARAALRLGTQTALMSCTAERLLRVSVSFCLALSAAAKSTESKLPKPDFQYASLSTRGPTTSTAPAVPRGLPWKTLGFKASGGVGFSFQP